MENFPNDGQLLSLDNACQTCTAVSHNTSTRVREGELRFPASQNKDDVGWQWGVLDNLAYRWHFGWLIWRQLGGDRGGTAVSHPILHIFQGVKWRMA